MKFNVPDMTCGHCVATITRAVKAVDPAAAVKADLAGKTVTVGDVRSGRRGGKGDGPGGISEYGGMKPSPVHLRPA